MKKSRRTYLRIALLVVVAVAAVALYVWNKPRRSVSGEEGIEVTAAQIVQEYQANEGEANKKYLDKAIQVTGTVAEVNNNQDGNTTVTLSSDDPMTGIFCTLKENTARVTQGSSVTIKGFCSGMLSDVRLREAVVVK